MATVKTTTIGCLGREYKQVIRYKSSRSRFYITLPGELPENEVSGKTEDEVVKSFKKAISDFTESVTKTEKVILYGYEVAAYITSPNKDEYNDREIIFNSGDSDCDFGPKFGNADGIQISLWVDVCEKTTRVFGDGKDVMTYKEIEETLIPESLCAGQRSRWDWERANEIPWTQETEDFFVRAGLGFEKLILQLNAVFGSTKGLKQFMKAGQKLLTG